MTGDGDRKPTAQDARRSAAAREVMDRAIRRLNVLEAVILGFAGLAAIAGGWLMALLAGQALGAPFRLTWIVSSLLLFIVPGVLVRSRERRASRAKSTGASPRAHTGSGPDGGPDTPHP